MTNRLVGRSALIACEDTTTFIPSSSLQAVTMKHFFLLTKPTRKNQTKNTTQKSLLHQKSQSRANQSTSKSEFKKTYQSPHLTSPHLISTAGQNILFFLSTFSSKIPSSQAAQTVDPSPLTAKPAVRTPIEGPAMPPTRMRRRTAS